MLTSGLLGHQEFYMQTKHPYLSMNHYYPFSRDVAWGVDSKLFKSEILLGGRKKHAHKSSRFVPRVSVCKESTVDAVCIVLNSTWNLPFRD